MCNAATRKLIEDVVENLVMGSEMFTAFDVTQRIRKVENVYHSEVRNEVHKLLSMGDMPGYIKQMHSFTVNGSPVRAFVFLPDTLDVMDYDPDHAAPNVITPVTVATSGAPTPPKLGPNMDPTDKRGRLCIPCSWTRKMNWRPGDWVLINAVPGGGMDIFQVTRSSCNSLDTFYQVDRDGNVRISASTLKKFSLDTSNGVTFDTNYSGMLFVRSK